MPANHVDADRYYFYNAAQKFQVPSAPLRTRARVCGRGPCSQLLEILSSCRHTRGRRGFGSPRWNTGGAVRLFLPNQPTLSDCATKRQCGHPWGEPRGSASSCLSNCRPAAALPFPLRWYTDTAVGCGTGRPGTLQANCTWRVAERVKRISKSCLEQRIYAHVQQRGAACFATCAQPLQIATKCWTDCFCAPPHRLRFSGHACPPARQPRRTPFGAVPRVRCRGGGRLTPLA